MASAYRITRHIMQPNPRLVVWCVGVLLIAGTLSSIGYLLSSSFGASILVEPTKMAAVAVLYAIDLLALYTVGKMSRRFTRSR